MARLIAAKFKLDGHYVVLVRNAAEDLLSWISLAEVDQARGKLSQFLDEIVEFAC